MKKFAKEEILFNQFIKGWTHSRRIDSVKTTELKGIVLAEFDQPIGTIKRKYEIFILNSTDVNYWDLNQLCNNEFHFVTLFNPSSLLRKQLEQKQYQNITTEYFMSCDITSSTRLKEDGRVEIIYQSEDALWYNQQRGSHVISDNKLVDNRIIHFYIKQSNELASWAKLILLDRIAILDDVQTKGHL